MGKGTRSAAHNPPQFFDRIFKRLMELSGATIIRFINGLFGKDYPLDSMVILLSTEHTTESLKQVRGDMVIEINHRDKYLIEIQKNEDEEMAFRIFDYTYLEAVRTKAIADNCLTLTFSQAMVIYLEPTAKTPRELISTLKFPDQRVYTMSIPTMRLLDYSIAELEERNLSILLPFYLLKLRKQIKATRSRKKRREFAGVMKQMMGEILDTLERSEAKGLLTQGDMNRVIEMMGRIYDTLYKPYPEFKENNEMVNGMILTYSEEAALKTEKRIKAQFAKYLTKEGWSKEKIAEAIQLDFPSPLYPEDTIPAYSEEAVLKKAKEIAQNLIKEGWSKEKIAQTTQLDLSTVESLYGSAQGKADKNP